MPFFLLFFFFSISMTLTYNYKPSNLYSFILRKMSPGTLFPSPQKEEESVSLCPLPVSTVAELMPGCSQIITLSQSCSLLPGSQEKPFLKARKEHIRKFRFGVFIEKTE